MHGQQNDKYTEMHGQQNFKIEIAAWKQADAAFRMALPSSGHQML
jgi:hypothetical protein